MASLESPYEPSKAPAIPDCLLHNVAYRASGGLLGVMAGSGLRCASISVTLNVRVFSCVLKGVFSTKDIRDLWEIT